METSCTNIAHTDETLSLLIGDIRLRNKAFLAPMSGVTDAPFRRLAWEYGAGMVVSEMVASEALMTGQDEMRLKAESAGLPVHMVQLAGREPFWMKEAARLAEVSGADIIDINMGCPSKRVTNGYSGSALMKDLDHAMTLVDAVVEAVAIPVTLKMRLGWDHKTINAPQLAKRAEDAGIQMITVHGRTRDQFYKGKADWTAIAQVSDAITVPLIVNGDIASSHDAVNALNVAKADGVMLGRACYGAPWLAGQIGAHLNFEKPPLVPEGPAFAEFVARHYEAIICHYGTELGVRNARKHLDWYWRHLPAAARDTGLRRALMTSTDPTFVLDKVKSLYGEVFWTEDYGKAA